MTWFILTALALFIGGFGAGWFLALHLLTRSVPAATVVLKQEDDA